MQGNAKFMTKVLQKKLKIAIRKLAKIP